MNIKTQYLFLFTFVIAQLSFIESCITRTGDQTFLDDPLEEDEQQWYKGIEIYANKFNPDKCNYGEWNKGDYPAAYMRKMRYKGFISISNDPINNHNKPQSPIKDLKRLMDIVEQRAQELGANIVCGGNIDKSPYKHPAPNTSEIEEYVYEFYGVALHSGPPIPSDTQTSNAEVCRITHLSLLFNVIVITFAKFLL